jgi:aminoglycoside phosphotransferase (APT) family kinase protein
MQDYKNIRPGEELPWLELETYLRKELPSLSGDFTYAQFHGGHANLTYLLRFGDRELVLRRPPFGKIALGAHDMKREYKVLSALHPSFPTAPNAFHLCTDHDIIGSDFVVMERREGVVIRTVLPDNFAGFDNASERLSDALMKVCSDLHLVDTVAAGLSDLGKPDGFTDRQLKGWAKRWSLAKLEDSPQMDKLMDKLLKDVPQPQRISIVHGDLKFDNCQFQADNPDAVSSVFDWDMATLGDPLIDLGGLLSYWPEKMPSGQQLPTSMMQGDWPTKTWLKERYAAHSGLDLSRMDWYEAFACYKSAGITQQLYARFVAGKTKDKRMAMFGEVSKVFAQLGTTLLNP